MHNKYVKSLINSCTFSGFPCKAEFSTKVDFLGSSPYHHHVGKTPATLRNFAFVLPRLRVFHITWPFSSDPLFLRSNSINMRVIEYYIYTLHFSIFDFTFNITHTVNRCDHFVSMKHFLDGQREKIRCTFYFFGKYRSH